jgi:hypothetical protein
LDMAGPVVLSVILIISLAAQFAIKIYSLM